MVKFPSAMTVEIEAGLGGGVDFSIGAELQLITLVDNNIASIATRVFAVSVLLMLPLDHPGFQVWNLNQL
jgi:hypothetical protein